MFVPEPEAAVPVRMFGPQKKIDLHTVNPSTQQMRRRDDWRAEDALRDF